MKSAPKPERPKREKSQERPQAKRPSAPAPAPAPPPAPAKQGTSLWVWLAIPVLAVLAVGGYIAWDVYTEQLKAKQLEEEQREQVEVPTQPERSREVKVGGDEPPVETTPTAMEPEKVDKPEKTPPRRAPTPKPPASVGAKALAALKADYGRLADEGVAKRFKLKLNRLDAEVATKGDDPAFVDAVTGLHEQVKAELAKQ